MNRENGFMENFDFTQFISFDSDMMYDTVSDTVNKYFEPEGFSVIEFSNVDEVKKKYYCDYWKKHSFELQKDDFLSDFMDWENVSEVPKSIINAVCKIKKLLEICNTEIVFIICYFAEYKKTRNEVVYISQASIYDELFKMSIHSFMCPENLIIHIRKG